MSPPTEPGENNGAALQLAFPSVRPDDAGAQMKHLKSMTAHARHGIVIGLCAKLEEMSLVAKARAMADLEVMLANLSQSIRLSAAEISAATFGPALIGRMSASVSRIEQNFTG